MYACPACGDELKYDISIGKLVCGACRTQYQPGDKKLVQNVTEEQEYINAKIYTCPMCGGEMYTTDIDATAFCSYCGASNVLESRMEGVDRPQKIIPFTVTKEACEESFNRMAKKTLFAPREFKNGSGLQTMRPLYVPYRLYHVTLNGPAKLYGRANWIDGVTEYVEDREITCNLHGDFKDISYDASIAFDDTLAKQIGPFSMKESQPFDSTYLAGAYANIPDVDTEIYREKALEFAAEETLETMHNKSSFGSLDLKAYPDGSSFKDHLPVTDRDEYTALLPIWFTSFRRGKRIAYAAVNGQNGKVYSDIPVSLPAFWLSSLLVSLPIFLLFNLFFTFRPTTGLLIACLLAFVAAILYTGNSAEIRRRELHLDDVGYRASRDELERAGGSPLEQDFFHRVILGKESRAKPKMKKNIFDFGLKAFSYWPYIVMAVLAMFFFRPLLWAMITVSTAIYCLRKTGGRINFLSALLLLAGTAGLIIRELNLVSDLWFYGGSILILVLTVIALSGLLIQYNLLATRPLPLLFRDGKPGSSGDDPGKMRKTAAFLLAFLVMAASLAGFFSLDPIPGKAEETQVVDAYENPETGYLKFIEDDEDLLTADEEKKLLEDMEPLTRYGHVIFLTDNQQDKTALQYAKDWYYLNYQNQSGCLFLIDMGTRELALVTAGSDYKAIGDDEGYLITDNVYKYASKGNYYSCAREAFSQCRRLLEGYNIPRPMKYINNVLLALILSVLINYALILVQAKGRKTGRSMLVSEVECDSHVDEPRWNTMKAISRFSFVGLCTILARFILRALIESALSGGGSDSDSGSGSGGSGGGFSGGGGSHRF